MGELTPIRRTPRIEIKDVHPCATALSAGQTRELAQLSAILGQSRAAYTRACLDEGLVLIEGGAVDVQDIRVSNKAQYSHIKIHGETLKRVDKLVDRYNSNRRHIMTLCILVGLDVKKKASGDVRTHRSETTDARLSRLEEAMDELLQKFELKPLRDRI